MGSRGARPRHGVVGALAALKRRSLSRHDQPTSEQGPRRARRNDMHNAYIIEIDEEAVAIAARDAGGFRFHAALHAVNQLDGRLYPSLREATRAARAVINAGGRDALGGKARASKHLVGE